MKQHNRVQIVYIMLILMTMAQGAVSARGSDETDVPKPPMADPAHTAVSVSTDGGTVVEEEFAHDPNELLPEQRTAMQSEPNPASPTARTPSTRCWQHRYHPQVTERIFQVLCYPYYPGGNGYPHTGVISQATHDANAIQTDPNQADTELKLKTLHHTLETYCDLIHQWRTINESADVTLEVVRSIELTRRATGIYHINAELAIDVKRTLGRIGRLNQTFDFASRLAMENLLRRHHDKLLTAQLEKHVHELQSLFEMLCEQNDHITVALGIGKIDRQAHRADRSPIYYTNLGLPNVPSQLYKEQ